jgi:pyruvate-ferredoxin/flavodoxin oxidoreductase
MEARESTLDTIAQAMADLATSSGAPAGGPLNIGLMGSPSTASSAPTASAPSAAAPAAAATAPTGRPIWLDPADLPKCNDCATCYQELPQLFEKATIIVDNEPRTVGRMMPDALKGLVMTDELAARIARVKSTCDAEIIQ